MATRRLTAAIALGEDGWHVARCLELEVTSQGKTFDDALENLREALELYFEDENTVSSIRSPIIAPIDVEISP